MDIEDGDRRETTGRREKTEQQELVRDRLVKWNKVKRGGTERIAMRMKNVSRVERTEELSPGSQNSNKNGHSKEKKKKKKQERIGCSILVVAMDAAIINPRGWHHGIYQVAGVWILVAVKSENKTVLMTTVMIRRKECEQLLTRAVAWNQQVIY